MSYITIDVYNCIKKYVSICTIKPCPSYGHINTIYYYYVHIPKNQDDAVDSQLTYTIKYTFCIFILFSLLFYVNNKYYKKYSDHMQLININNIIKKNFTLWLCNAIYLFISNI